MEVVLIQQLLLETAFPQQQRSCQDAACDALHRLLVMPALVCKAFGWIAYACKRTSCNSEA